MAVGKKLLSVFFSFTLVMGLLPYSAFADPSDSSSDSTKSSSDASTSNESEFADGGVASKPDPSDFEGGMDSNGSVSGAEDAGFGVDGDFADEQELSAPDYSDGKLAIWADGLDDPSDIADVYPPDTNEIEAYANGSNLQPMSFSSEMLYFCKYESSCNYDQGLSSGDGYHAMGYFQFDNRYGLGSFLKAVYNYNPSTYSALKVIGDRYGWNVTGATRSNGAFTQLGNDLNAAWHAAYKANPTEFSNLQNGWAYIDSYNGSLGARGCLKAFGINLDNRPDCIKGLCWGMVNLFGAGGGASYINNGNYYGANWFFKNSGINDSMSDEVFVTTLCDYVVNNVAKRYPKQSIYWTGWQNRYKSEKADCLGYLSSNVFTIDVSEKLPSASVGVDEGEFVIASALGGRNALQLNGSGSASSSALSINRSDMGKDQMFSFEKDTATGLMRIRSVGSSNYLSLNVSGSKMSPNVSAKAYSADDKGQLWLIEKGADNNVVICAALNANYCLDVSGGSSSEGTRVALYVKNGTAAQKWAVYNASPDIQGGRTVDDGVYSILAKSDPSKALAVSGSGNGSNVQLSDADGASAQRFRFELGADGFYTVTNLRSGKVLDVADGSVLPGSNVQQWSGWGGDAQKWAVRDNGDGSYSLVCKANGLALDLDGTASGSNAQAWALSADRSQSFSLEPASGQRTVPDGTYVVSTGLDRGKVLDVSGGSVSDSARIQIYESNMTNAQAFRFTFDEKTGYYEIANVGSGKVLDAAGGSSADGTRVQQYSSNGTMAQRWSVVADGDGYRVCSALDDSKVLDVKWASSANGTDVQLYGANGSAAQRFYLSSTEHEPVSPCKDLGLDGWYEIVPSESDTLCVDISGASKSDGAKVQLYSRNQTLAQLFKFEYSDGYYRLISLNSEKAIGVKNGSIVPGSAVVQSSKQEDGSQQFSVKANPDGTYTFICVANALSLSCSSLGSEASIVGQPSDSGYCTFRLEKPEYVVPEGLVKISSSLDTDKVLDVANASESDGANVQLYSSNSTFAQKWMCTHVEGHANVYRFESLCSGKNMAERESNVCVEDPNPSAKSQMWLLAGINSGAYSFVNLESGKSLDVRYASTSNGTNIQTYEYNGSKAQQFIFETVSPVAGGTYVIHSKSNYGQAVDVKFASTESGANVWSYEANGSGAQKWNITANGDGSYRIENAPSKKVLDVANGNAAEGNNVQQYAWNGSAAQKWYISYGGSGGFYLESALNRKFVLSIENGSPVNGANYALKTKNASATQLFSFEKTTYVPPMPSDRKAMQDRIWGYSSGTQWLIGVDRSTHRVGVFKGSANNWSLQYWWSCVTGAPSAPTITGYYRTTGGKRMSLSTDSRAKWCTQIWNGYFFHTILNSDAELGNSLSHGCLRMSYPSAQWIYSNVYAGTAVLIYN